MDKQTMFEAGCGLVSRFCELHDIEAPTISVEDKDTFLGPARFATCAYYRQYVIHIDIRRCAHIGTANRAWSYPGWMIDKTPYGVLQHELGHHIERLNPDIAMEIWSLGGQEKKITGYCPNVHEWFAEHFRLFVTNPELHGLIRPKTHELLLAQFPEPAETRSWQDVLAHAPERTQALALRRVAEA